jgi:hypothetical protein
MHGICICKTVWRNVAGEQCQKRPAVVSKETYCSVKGDGVEECGKGAALTLVTLE